MELRPRWKIRWLVIALLMLPTLVWFAYSLIHPGAKKNGEKLYRLVEVPVHAEQASPSSPWVMQESGTTAGLRGIYSVDGKIAWASGTGGAVLKTVDSGEHWQKCAIPDAATDGASLDFRGVQAWDAQTAIVMASGPGEKSRLYKTGDSCKSWKLLLKNEEKDGFWDTLRLWTPSDGFLAGDPVEGHPFWTEFTSWNGLMLDNILFEKKANKGDGAFAASNSCIALASFHKQDGTARQAWFAMGGESGSRVFLYKHFNGGDPERQSLSVTSLAMFPKTASGGIFSIAFRNEDHGLAVGGDYAKPIESSLTAAWTSDGGLAWTAATRPPHGYRSSVAWSELLKAWIAAGTNGSDISRDDGKTWQPLDDGNWNALSLPFVVGPNGRIARLSMPANLPK